MATETFTFEENGQMKINFDALELVTSKAFVTCIEVSIAKMGLMGIHQKELHIDVFEIDDVISVIVASKWDCYRHMYWKYDGFILEEHVSQLAAENALSAMAKAGAKNV